MSNDTNEKPAALLETLMRQFLGEILPPPEAVEASKAYANGFLRDGDPEQSAEAIKAAAMQAAMMKTAAECGEEPPVDMRGAIDRLFETGSIDKNPAEHDKALQELEESFRDIKAKSAEVIGASKTRQELTTAAIGAVGDGAALLSRIYSSAAADTGTEKDTFIRNGLEGHPDTVAEAVNVCKDVLASAARSAAMIMGGSFAVGASMLPAKADKAGGAALKMLLFMLYDEDDITGSVLQSLPKTMEYMRQHAPEHAAELEACAREEVKKAFLPLLEYVNGLGKEDAEPVEGKEPTPAALQTVPILKRIDGTDKLTQALFAGKVGKNYVNVAMETAGSAKEVTSAICLLDYDGFTLPNGQPLVLTPFLYELYNAVCTIRAAGNRVTTYNMINKVMTGKTGRGKSKEVNLKPERKELLRKGLQILRVGVSMDIREEVDAGYIKDEKLKGTRFEKLKNAKKRPTYIDDVLLDTRVIGNVEIDGHMMDEVIEIKDEPILYSYSKMRGQVSTYPLEVLNAPIRNTADNMAVRGILIRWILMGEKKKDFYKLNYEKIFEAVGISAADKSSGTNKRRTQIRKTIDACLIYWKKIKFIHNYEVTRRGMKYLSISVTTPEQIEEWKGKQQHKRKAH